MSTRAVSTEGSRKTVLSMQTKMAPSRDRVSQVIVFLSSGIAALLPAAGRDKGVVELVFFGDRLYIYYAFLVCVMFAFSCAFSAILLLHTKPKAARQFKLSGIMFFSSAVILFLNAIFYNYNYVEHLCKYAIYREIPS